MRIVGRPVAWTPVAPGAGRCACIALASAVFGLALADLVSASLCLLAVAALALIAWTLPHQSDPRWRAWPGRSPLAVLALTGTAVVGWATVPGGGQDALFLVPGPLGSLQVGTLAALAAGALVAVGLECGERRGLRSGLMLSIAVLALTTVSLPGPDLLPALLICWPATLLALARVAATAGVSDGVRAARTSPSLPGAGPSAQILPLVAELRRILVPLAAASVAGAMLFVVALWVRPDVSAFGAGGVSGGLGDSGLSGPRSSGTYLGGQMNLRRRGSLSDEPVANVPLASPRLWRAATLDTYTGAGWNATAPAGTRSSAAVSTPGRAVVTPAPGFTPPTSSATADVDVVGELRQAIAPGQLLAVEAPERQYATGLRYAIAGPGDVLELGTSFQFQPPSAYRVTYAALPDADDVTDAPTLAAAVQTEAAAPDPIYTRLPVTVPERVLALGRRVVAGAPDRLAAVQAVEQEVRSRMVYRLDSPVPRLGTDAVDDALFTSHSGFCEQFASAAAVLLRAGGVPARVAVGFSGGEPSDGSGAGRRMLLQSDAHAWIEVWFPGVGWVSADPTPPGDLDQSWWSSVRTSVQGAVRAVQRLVLAQGPWLPVVVLALAGAVLVLVRSIRRSRSGPQHRTVVDPRLAAAFAQLERGLRVSGAPRGPGETVAALGARLDLPALLVLERALYAAVPPDDDECSSAAHKIEDAARELTSVRAPVLNVSHRDSSVDRHLRRGNTR